MSDKTPEQKAKGIAYKKAYYIAHRKEILAKAKEYRVTNPEKRRACIRAYYIANREKCLARGKAYNIAHREERNAHAKAYRANHREERLAYSRIYAITHKGEIRARQKDYRAKHREEIAASGSAYRKARPGIEHKWHLQRKYSMSQEEFDALLLKQSGACAICGSGKWNGKGPHVDHDHKTGNVRGILCNACNTALGMVGDDPMIARSMAHYLEERAW